MSIERATALMARQHGAAHYTQLLTTGLTDAQVDARCRSGSWTQLHPFVYGASGAPPTEAQRVTAAWLAVRFPHRGGPPRPVAVGGRYAARLLGMDVTPSPVVELVVPGGSWFPCLRGVRVRRVSDWPERTFTRLGGVLVTGRPDTLVDVAHSLTDGDALTLFQAQCFDRPHLRVAVVTRCHRGSKGSARARRVAGELARGLDSVVHRAGVRALRAAGLAPDACDVEVVAGAGASDCVYYGAGVVVEFDGDVHRLVRAVFLHDRRKDLLLRRHGYDTLRFTAEQVASPGELVAHVRAALTATA
jgi:hypothetical protein